MNKNIIKSFTCGVIITTSIMIAFNLGKYKLTKSNDHNSILGMIKDTNTNEEFKEFIDYSELIIDDFTHANEKSYIEMRQEYNQLYLSNLKKFNDYNELIEFFKKQEKHLNEYYKCNTTNEIIEERNNIANIPIQFIISNQEIGGYYYNNLNNKCKSIILEIASNMLFIQKNGYPKESKEFEEYKDKFKKILLNFIHAN